MTTAIHKTDLKNIKKNLQKTRIMIIIIIVCCTLFHTGRTPFTCAITAAISLLIVCGNGMLQCTVLVPALMCSSSALLWAIVGCVFSLWFWSNAHKKQIQIHTRIQMLLLLTQRERTNVKRQVLNNLFSSLFCLVRICSNTKKFIIEKFPVWIQIQK